jgi:putative NADPH-quinone reductase
MKCLVVVAHPLRESLSSALAASAAEALRQAGREVWLEDLYRDGFAAALSAAERESYYGRPYDASAVQPNIDRLLAAEGLVVCFPTWWFGFPAILKGWFDRVWAPGVAYDHADDLGPIRPRLRNLRHTLAVTSLSAPRRVDWLVLRRPAPRVLKWAILGACAPACKFEMLTIYKAERLRQDQVDRLSARMKAKLAGWR